MHFKGRFIILEYLLVQSTWDVEYTDGFSAERYDPYLNEFLDMTLSSLMVMFQ